VPVLVDYLSAVVVAADIGLLGAVGVGMGCELGVALFGVIENRFLFAAVGVVNENIGLRAGAHCRNSTMLAITRG
jgi:hypothetical protein